MVPSLAHQVVSRKHAAQRILNTSQHFLHVLHDLFNRRVFHPHIYRPDSYHQVETRYDVPSILDEFVEIGEVMRGVLLPDGDGKVSQRIEDGHVEFIVCLGGEGAYSQLTAQARAVEVSSDFMTKPSLARTQLSQHLGAC